MSDGRKYYCLCEANCKFETMTKEQILAAIAEAAHNGLVFDTEAAFITKVKERNAGSFVTFWVGTTAQYNALAEKDANCVYIKTDDATRANIEAAFQDITQHFDDVDTTLMQYERIVGELNEKLEKKSDVSHTHTTYAAKSHTHAEYVECKLDTGLVNAVSYTTTTDESNAEYYHITIGSHSNSVVTAETVVVNRKALQAFATGSTKWYLIPNNATDNHDKLSVTINADGTIKFYYQDDTNSGRKILHIAGYY